MGAARRETTGGYVVSELADLMEWMLWQTSGHAKASPLWRIYREPGRSGIVGHRILHDAPPMRLHRVWRAFSTLDPVDADVLALRYGWRRHGHHCDGLCKEHVHGVLVTNTDRARLFDRQLRSFEMLISGARDLLLEAYARRAVPLDAGY